MAFNLSSSQSVVGILSASRVSLQDANDNGLPQPTNDAQDLVDKYTPYCVTLDSNIVPIIAQINTKKQQIVTICSQASSCGLSSIASSIDSQYGGTNSVITGAGATAYGNTVGLATTSVIAYGIIRKDNIKAYQYPNLENGVYDTTNPLENAAYAVITSSSNQGTGDRTELFENDSSGDFLGYCYGFSGPAGICAGYASSISTIIGEIATLRSSINVTDVTTLKGYKHQAQLSLWSINHVQSDNTATSTNHQNVINIINSL
jgi:hypothetical protein